MRLEFLGNALDHFKGSILRRLRSEGLLQELRVDPMATDGDSWKKDHYQLYADLLGVPADRVFEHREPFGHRSRVLDHAEYSGDLFLDPDTGISISNPSPRHIMAEEVKNFSGRTGSSSSTNIPGERRNRGGSEDWLRLRKASGSPIIHDRSR